MKTTVLSSSLALLLVAAVALAQQVGPVAEQIGKNEADRQALEDCTTNGVTGPIGVDFETGRIICATPVAGGGGSETCVTCTRSSATVYTCTGLSSITKVRVNSAWQIATPTPATINEYRVSGSTVTFGYSIDASCLTTACQVVACGS